VAGAAAAHPLRNVSDWSVYIIRCDNSTLYTGISTDVARRLKEHRSGDRKAAKYTKPFSSIDLVYEICVGDRSLAAKIEYQVKKLPRQKKDFIVSNHLSRDKLMALLDLDRE
jgi:putative endonuclease